MTTMIFASVLAATLMVASVTPTGHSVNSPAVEAIATRAAAMLPTRERATALRAERSNALYAPDRIARGFVQRKGCLRWWSCGPFHRERSRLA